MSDLLMGELKKEIIHYQSLVEFAVREINSGNEKMRDILEGYANHRDSLQIQLDSIRQGLSPARKG